MRYVINIHNQPVAIDTYYVACSDSLYNGWGAAIVILDDPFDPGVPIMAVTPTDTRLFFRTEEEAYEAAESLICRFDEYARPWPWE